MAAKFIEPDRAQQGDILIWELPEGDSGPPGATLIPSVKTDDYGQRVQVWWRYVMHPGPQGWPAPLYAVADVESFTAATGADPSWTETDR